MFIMTPHPAEIGLVCNNTSLFSDHMILFSHLCEASYSPLSHLSNSKEWVGVISNISNTRDSVSSEHPKTEKKVENETRSEYF